MERKRTRPGRRSATSGPTVTVVQLFLLSWAAGRDVEGQLRPASRVDTDEIAKFVSGPKPVDIAEMPPSLAPVN
jgi:hypothetical protein